MLSHIDNLLAKWIKWGQRTKGGWGALSVPLNRRARERLVGRAGTKTKTEVSLETKDSDQGTQ